MIIGLNPGSSPLPDTRRAMGEATRRALVGAPDPAFALVFVTEQHDPDEFLAAAQAELGSLPWVGCCVPAAFHGAELLRQGVVVGVVSSRAGGVGVGVAGPVSRDPQGAGQQATREAIRQLAPGSQRGGRGLLLLLDVLQSGASEVVRGAAREAGAGWAWAGGCAGTSTLAPRPTRFVCGRPVGDEVVAIALAASGVVAASTRHGWRPYGPPTLVTRARGSVVLELDGEDIGEVYRRTARACGDTVPADDLASFAMSHPLGIPQASGAHVIRDPLALEPGGGLRFVAEIPEGCLVRLMQGDVGSLLDAAGGAAEGVRREVGGVVAGGIAFDCVSRSLLLGDRLPDELAAFQRGLGDGVPFFGGLSLGEVGALGRGVPQVHNKAVAVLGWSRSS